MKILEPPYQGGGYYDDIFKDRPAFAFEVARSCTFLRQSTSTSQT